MEFRKKTMATLLIAIFMISTFAVVYAQPPEGIHLVATEGGPGTGTEARISIIVPEGTTLNDIVSISWMQWLVEGYAPHVDIILEDDALCFEYTYNDLPGHDFETGLTGAWYATFSDDLNGPPAITDTAMAWACSGPPGSPPDPLFIYHSLNEWKGGITYTTQGSEKTVNGDSIVLRLEIEIDNWVLDTEAYIKNIQVNGGVGLILEVLQPTVGITVSPTSVDFGKLKPGAISEKQVTVSNIGDYAVTVTHTVEGQFYIDNLVVTDPAEIPPGEDGLADLVLTIPDPTPPGIYTGKVVFEATPAPP